MFHRIIKPRGWLLHDQGAISATTTQHEAFAGGPRQAVVLGRLYVLSGYCIILATLFYAVIAASSVMVIFIQAACPDRIAMRAESLLYGTGVSPLCRASLSGQAIALAVPTLELALILLLIRGLPALPGEEVDQSVSATVHRVFAPIMPHIERLPIRRWNGPSRITSAALLLSQHSVTEVQRWAGGAAVDTRKLSTHAALFATLHELGHVALHDLLYNRRADQAILVASAFLALFLAIAMPAGALGGGYWLRYVTTGVECAATFQFSRYVFARIMTNFEFLVDNYAAAQATRIVGRRLALPPAPQPQATQRLRRAHPPLSSRREYVRAMNCGELLQTYLLLLPIVVLIWLASTPRPDPIAAIGALTHATDLVTTAALCVLGILGGAAATVNARLHRLPWICYAATVLAPLAFVATDGLFDTVPFVADAAGRLSVHGRLWLSAAFLASPLVGALLRRSTNWFDVAIGPSNAAAPLFPSSWMIAPTSGSLALPRSWRAILTVARNGINRLALAVYRGFVTLAAIAAAVFALVLLEYIFDTGILSWVHVACFAVYLLIPLSHVIWPLRRIPLILDMLLQAFMLSAVVVLFAALSAAYELRKSDLPLTGGGIANSAMLADDAASLSQMILDGTVFRLRGDEILRDVLWLYAMLAVVGTLRLAGQIQTRQRHRRITT